MTRSRVWKFVPGLFVLVGVPGLLLSPMRAQAPAQPPSEYPMTIPVASGPHLNLFPHLMAKAEVLAALAQVQDSQDLVVKTNFAITLRAASNTTKLPWKLHTEADELWFVYKGTAKVSLAPFSLMVGVTVPGNTYDAAEGDIVNVPRGMAYQVMPAGRFEYVAVRKFLIPSPATGRAGGPETAPAPPPIVVTKAQIDQFYATATGSVSLYPGITRNLYPTNGIPGPVENHEIDEHLYVATYGTAKAYLDGFITGAHWDTRGLMGTGTAGSTEYTMNPGDLLFVFRNTLHYIVPLPTTSISSNKAGYLLVDLGGTSMERALPKAVIPNGTGAY